MYHALEIDEILLNIFAHCNPPRFKNYKHGRPFGVAADLVALATTCRMFKEPALDVLWSELSDLCPLATCLPEAAYQITPGFKWYSFKRPLDQTEWDTLRSYTRRVCSVLDFGSAFHPECVRTFLSPSVPEPLFPNLRYLRCIFANEVTPLLHQPLPSLVSLDYSFIFEGSDSLFRESLESFPGVSSNMKSFSVRVHQPEVTYDKLVSGYICRWSNPRSVFCPQIVLDVNALTHLSRASDLTRLTFALSADALVPSNPLLFSALRELKIFSESLDPISKFLGHMQLPTVADLTAEITGCPSNHDLTSFLETLQPCGMANSLTRLGLTQIHHSLGGRSEPIVLTAHDLRPGMALRNLRRIELNLGWDVGLTDDDLLELTSAWPDLEYLLINEEDGWRSAGGITLDGLARLLQTCPSLTRLAVAVDTRRCTDVPVGPPADRDRDRRPEELGSFSLNVVDSVIDGTCSVPAIAARIAEVVPCARVSLSAWSSWAFTWRANKRVYAERWREVFVRVGDTVSRRFAVSG